MNLHGIVSGAIGAVNPHRSISLKRSNGYTKDASHKQVPSFDAPVTGMAQIQGVTPSQLKHAAEMNIQGVLRRVYLYGNWMGVVRADKVGGDILTFAQVPGGALQDWKIFVVYETFPDWCSVGVVLQ